MIPAAEPEELPRSAEPADWVAWAVAAVTVKDWQEAAVRWSHIIRRFGPRPDWRMRKGQALLASGRVDEAAAIFIALEGERPRLGLVGQANVAMHRRDWDRALQLWNVCIERFGGESDAGWHAARARTLRQLGRTAEAETAFRDLARRHPEKMEFAASAVRAALDGCEIEGSLTARRDGLLTYIAETLVGKDDLVRMTAMNLVIAMGELEQAACRLAELIESVEDPVAIEGCMIAIPMLFDRGGRGAHWQRLLDRLSDPLKTGRGAVDLELRLLLALERFPQFIARFDQELPSSKLLGRVRARLGKPRGEIFAERKIFGIGLSKTGTSSLTEALEMLDIDTAHWTNPRTN